MGTGNEITIVAPQSIEESERLAATLGKASLIPDALRGKPADILATILAGAELGLAPMQAIRGISIVKGKPTLSADTMGALCKRRADVCEYLTLVTSSSQVCTYEAKRKGEPAPTRMSFSMEDATRAGLAGSDTYRKFPAAMLRARCLAAICRAVFPDLCLGLYDPDEAEEISAPQAVHIAEQVGNRAEEVLRAKLKPVPVQDAAFTPAPPSPPSVQKALDNVAPHVTAEPPPVPQAPPASPPKQHRAPIVDVPSVPKIKVDGKAVPVSEATTPQLEDALQRGKAVKQTPEVQALLAAVTAELAHREEAIAREFAQAGETGSAA